MKDRSLVTAYRLSVLVAVLMAAQALSGMVAPGLYRDDVFALNAWRLNDPVALLLALPTLVLSLIAARRGSLRGTLVWFGALQFALYNYAFYLFGAAINVFFPLYVALFALSGFALIFGLAGLDISGVTDTFQPRRTDRLVAGYLAFWALDLAFVVAPVGLAAVWVWCRQPWGRVIAVVMLVKGVLYSTLLSAASLPLFGTGWGGDPLLPLWLVLLAGAAMSLVVLLSPGTSEKNRRTP